ncbi:short-chain dehydrogenase [Acinetobacter defluvii]|uniref:SDR family oxidoreductase n=1 Tax=Acinetobacter defluvii TaxID=1871111 RepID=UPI00148F678D|nr:SDR family oxidoreductase [Acinetobacter defluvii]NNP72270.1 short-chain dehydrogenase [Acinetobacter defluvii]
MRLQGKIIFISGATSGIGFASAQRAIAEGAFVVFSARNAEKIHLIQQQLGQQSLGFQCDHSCLKSQQSLIQQLNEKHFKFDGVFLNAGNVHHEQFGKWTEAAFDAVFNTNIKGPFFLLQDLMPLLNHECSIILCGSTSIHIALEQSSVYAASKIALRSLVKTLSRELLQHKIRFNLLSPGPTLTPALDKVASSEQVKIQLQNEIKKLVPIQRLADPTEIANAFIYLVSNESKFVIGTEILVDGGVANL